MSLIAEGMSVVKKKETHEPVERCKPAIKESQRTEWERPTPELEEPINDRAWYSGVRDES